MARVDGERGEHREDALLEHLVEALAVVLVEVVVRAEDDADLGEARRELRRGRSARPEPTLVLDGVADLEELLRRRAAVGRGRGDAGRHLVLQAGDADLEELVEVLAEDGEELGPLEQRHVLALGQRQHAVVEVEPGELTVEEPGARRRRRMAGTGSA